MMDCDEYKVLATDDAVRYSTYSVNELCFPLSTKTASI